jgi:hypothetical protein
MHMVFDPAYHHGFEALISGNPGHVGPELGCNSSEMLLYLSLVLKIT